MMTLLASYTVLSSCYNEQTRLEVSEMHNGIIIHLDSSKNADCAALPTAVQIQLRFTNSSLDLQKVVTDFQYEITKSIFISAPDLSIYLNLSGTLMQLRSYSQILLLQIQQITLTRFKTSSVFHSLEVEYNQTVFTATTRFPSTFTALDVTDASLLISNFDTTYTVKFSGAPVVTLANFTLQLEFPNSALSQILYLTGISTITLRCTFGANSVLATGEISVSELIYFKQPSPGEISRFNIFPTGIFVQLSQSAYFEQQLARAETASILISLNDGACELLADFAAESVKNNIAIRGFFAANMDVRTFGSDAAEFGACTERVLEPALGTVSFALLDAENAPFDRVYFDHFPAQRSCFQDAKMTLLDAKLTISARSECDITAHFALLRILLYETPLDYFFDRAVALREQKFVLGRNLEVGVSGVPESAVARLKGAYEFRILILTKNGVDFDVFEPFFHFSVELKIVILEVSILGVCAVTAAAGCALVLFCKIQPRLKKVAAAKIEIDEL
ncbi:hypothetical protein SS50377_28436 [Spironucleus salmonicida]|uniref:Uncharacterized protein n=1 Tax=Spironucleus salmonicida TaxID=348837 RepID=V6LG11_9EUKA|nr:hypothetical protein SS50377_28436 [Spironucleus salmonicida]|eukprot:EST43208.1 Hypothetical protein SS50377_17151 [Spironucleus salmonicida]